MPHHKAQVFYNQELAGTLQQLPGGYEFAYTADYLKRPGALPISQTMPLQAEPFKSSTLFPFFDGLLPEGWLLDLTASVLKIDSHDRFELLLHTGSDTVGAVTVRPAPEG